MFIGELLTYDRCSKFCQLASDQQKYLDKQRRPDFYGSSLINLFVWFDYVPSTIFQLCRDGSSWVEPILS